MQIFSFIGIGVQKGGTSWLYKQFLNHPEIYVPRSRKEIHFFDEYYDRGLSWYQKWFKDANQNHKAVGEITPSYIYNENVPKRIKDHFPDVRFILILRHPVERAYSHYQMTFQSGEGQKYTDFDDFMTHHPHAFKRGLYAAQLERWFQYFNPDQFLILTSEEIFKAKNGIENTFKKVSGFLNINSSFFNLDLAQEKIGGARHSPRFPALSNLIQRIRIFLRDHDLDFIASAFKKLGITRQLFGSKKINIPPLTDEQNKKWLGIYQEDIKKLEILLTKHY